MSVPLAPEDLFAVGLGVEVAGAYVLARGLITGLPDMATAGTWAGMGGQASVKLIRDRVDATFGLAALAFGFLTQAAGYVVAAASVDSGATSGGRAATFAGVVVASLAAALLGWWLTADRRVRRLGLRLAYYDGEGVKQPRPRGPVLLDLGVELGHPAHTGETYGAYADRVWEVEDVEDADGAPREGEQLRRQPGRS